MQISRGRLIFLLAAVGFAGGARKLEISFLAERVQLWVTSEKPETWRLVKEYRLGPRVK